MGGERLFETSCLGELWTKLPTFGTSGSVSEMGRIITHNEHSGSGGGLPFLRAGVWGTQVGAEGLLPQPVTFIPLTSLPCRQPRQRFFFF